MKKEDECVEGIRIDNLEPLANMEIYSKSMRLPNMESATKSKGKRGHHSLVPCNLSY